MFQLRFIIIILFPGWFVFAQTESEKLLEQAETIVHYDPVEANRISEHILKISKDDNAIAGPLYVQAVSFYVMGKHGQALESGFAAKDKAREAGNSEIENKSTELIGRTLKFLNLNVPENLRPKKQEDIEPAFLAEDLIRKANESLVRNEKDSVFYYIEKAKDAFISPSPVWTTALYLKLKGEYYFKQKQLDSSVTNYRKALKITQKIKNPIILRELNQKLASSYLAMDSISKFQEYTQLAQNLTPEISKKENEASNSAHMLVSKDLDEQ